MNLTDTGLQERQAWEKAGIEIPSYDRAAMVKKTKEAPGWVHFGAGNIFRGFIAGLQDALLEEGLADTGIIAAETFDFDIMDKIYEPFDDLALLITLKADGSTEKKVIASIAEGVKADSADVQEWERREEPADKQHTDVGIKNIQQIIKLEYGTSYGLFMESEPGKGTCAHFILPVLEDGEME